MFQEMDVKSEKERKLDGKYGRCYCWYLWCVCAVVSNVGAQVFCQTNDNCRIERAKKIRGRRSEIRKLNSSFPFMEHTFFLFQSYTTNTTTAATIAITITGILYTTHEIELTEFLQCSSPSFWNCTSSCTAIKRYTYIMHTVEGKGTKHALVQTWMDFSLYSLQNIKL